MSSIPNQVPVVVSADGALVPSGPKTVFHITKATALAGTLGPPAADGMEVTIIDDFGAAHVVTVTGAGSPPTQGLNGGTTANTLTWGGTKGNAATLYSRNNFWYTGPLSSVTVG